SGKPSSLWTRKQQDIYTFPRIDEEWKPQPKLPVPYPLRYQKTHGGFRVFQYILYPSVFIWLYISLTEASFLTCSRNKSFPCTNPMRHLSAFVCQLFVLKIVAPEKAIFRVCMCLNTEDAYFARNSCSEQGVMLFHRKSLSEHFATSIEYIL
ncbi:MAG TPA: hypothetical protein PLV42_03755, partial [bacterium]|nr:hypothetical protein [bacterium]